MPPEPEPPAPPDADVHRHPSGDSTSEDGTVFGATIAPPAPARPDPSSAEEASGAVIPGYVIESEVGRGGMGVVFKARQLGLNRTVALKMILHAEYASEGDRARFRREAESLARLRHPN